MEILSYVNITRWSSRPRKPKLKTGHAEVGAVIYPPVFLSLSDRKYSVLRFYDFYYPINKSAIKTLRRHKDVTAVKLFQTKTY